MPITYKEINPYVYEAYDKKQLVGRLELLQMPELPDGQSDQEERPMLQNIRVSKQYQRRGIGTELLKKALENFPNLLVNDSLHIETDENDESGTYLSQEGRAFVNGCLSSGVLKENNLFTRAQVDEVNSEDGPEEEYEKSSSLAKRFR